MNSLDRTRTLASPGWRADFPLLASGSTVYLDSAASAQKPEAVLAAMEHFYRTGYANIHRGAYPLSVSATEQYEGARERVRDFIGAERADEVIFTRGTTESINLVAYSYGRRLQPGDEILLTLLEHHSNIVPWQIIAEQTGAVVKFVDVLADGRLDEQDFERKLSERTKIFSLTHLANGLGVALPVARLAAQAKEKGAVVVLDAAQSAPHLALSVQSLGVDFLAFSGHKIYGPTGIGVLYGKRALLEEMPPFMGGGDMIKEVRIDGTDYADPPSRFEAGTPNIAGAVGLTAAIDYVTAAGLDAIAAHEDQMVSYLEARLSEIEGVTIYGPKKGHTGLICFNVEGVHSHDLSQYLSRKNVAIRDGHHCAQPLLTRLGLASSARASVGMYTIAEDIDALAEAIEGAKQFFNR